MAAILSWLQCVNIECDSPVAVVDSGWAGVCWLADFRLSICCCWVKCPNLCKSFYKEKFCNILCMSVLQAIEARRVRTHLWTGSVLSNGKFIIFCWIPSHRDITGNEHADHAAKDALSKAQPTHFELPCTDVFMKIQPFVSFLWQEIWDKEVGNKLHAIMPQIDKKYYSACTNRKDEVIINRLRIGHTRLTHSFRMENGPHPPLCDQCERDHELTVKHVLIECNFLQIIRRRHYDMIDLNQLFKSVSSKRILDFVKDIGLYNSL